jgi:hypothetical protein
MGISSYNEPCQNDKYSRQFGGSLLHASTVSFFTLAICRRKRYQNLWWREEIITFLLKEISTCQ